MTEEFRLVVSNPGESPRQMEVGGLDEARRLAADQTRPGGRAELMDAEIGRTVWIRDGSTGEELQPGK